MPTYPIPPASPNPTMKDESLSPSDDLYTVFVTTLGAGVVDAEGAEVEKLRTAIGRLRRAIFWGEGERGEEREGKERGL